MSGSATPPAAAAWLAAGGLPMNWRGQSSFTVVDTGFGDGARLQALRRALQDDPQACACLAYWVFVPAEDARGVNLPFDPPSEADGQGTRLLPGIQLRHLDGGRLRLYLAVGPLGVLAGERVAQADLFWLSNPAYLPADRVTALTRRRAPGARAVVGPGHGQDVNRAVRAAGFEPAGRTGEPGLEGFVLRPALQPSSQDHRWGPLPPDPSFLSPPVAPRPRMHPGPLHGRRMAVLGAGLAGCATARSLADLGAEVHLFDRHEGPASETSGNPGGLVHSVFHWPDTPHSRLLRAAASHAARDGGIDRGSSQRSGGGRGLIQLQPDASLPAMQSALQASGLPGWHLEALDDEEAARASGLPELALRGHPAWHFRDGGWLDPAALCRRWIDPADGAPPNLHWHGGVDIASLERMPGGWRLGIRPPHPASGAPEGEFDAVVVAAAGAETRRLLAPHSDAALWPIEPVRGQLGLWDADTPGLRRPRLALTGQGYAIPLPDGRVLIGATSQPGRTDLEPRPEDDAQLRDQAARMGILESPARDASSASTVPGPMGPRSSRVGIRWRTPDRLPIIGPVADPDGQGRADQCRFVPRVPGLHVFTALGSRGIAWARFGAELLAAGMAGLPAPVESSLLDRLDPARFRVGRARNGGRQTQVR